MKKALFLSIMLWLAGCMNETRNPLYGMWGIDSREYIGGAIVKIDEDTFTYGLALQIDSASYGFEMSAGPYEELDDNKIKVTYTITTCPDHMDETTETVVYAIDGDKLTLTVTEGSVILYRVPDDDSAASGLIVRNGCWEDGFFTPHALTHI